MNTKYKALIAIFTLLITNQILANDASDVAGRYKSKTHTANIIALDDSTVATEISVATRNCSGQLSFIGTYQDGMIKLTPYRKSDTGSGLSCRVLGIYSPTQSKIIFEEKECSDWHGFSCSFSGELMKTE